MSAEETFEEAMRRAGYYPVPETAPHLEPPPARGSGRPAAERNPDSMTNLRITGSGPRGQITVADIRAVAGGRARRPPVTLRPVRFPWGFGPALDVDLYSLNPLMDVVMQLPGQPNPNGGERPTAFSTGDLPLFTTGGVDVELLRWVP
jgi:hypothetical protein